MAATSAKDRYTEEMEQKLEDLRTEFQQLELEQMKKGEVEARAKLAAAKKAVDKKRREAEDRLDTIRRASTSGWEDARDELDKAREELQSSIDRARKDFEGILEEEEEEEKATANASD